MQIDISPLKTLGDAVFGPFTQRVKARMLIWINVFKGEMYFSRFQLPNIGLKSENPVNSVESCNPV